MINVTTVARRSALPRWRIWVFISILLLLVLLAVVPKGNRRRDGTREVPLLLARIVRDPESELHVDRIQIAAQRVVGILGIGRCRPPIEDSLLTSRGRRRRRRQGVIGRKLQIIAQNLQR